MTVRESLLAILDQGPCYGYQLRTEFERRTGGSSPLNVGQVYNTLDRLERDGLAAKGDTDEQGHVYWRITDAGRADVRRWLGSPVARDGAVRDDLVVKVAVAATLPGVATDDLLHAEQSATRAHLDALHAQASDAAAAPGPEALARSLVLDARVFAAEAELRWLEHAAERLARHPEHSATLALSTERPKRGRPAAAPPVPEPAFAAR